MVECVVDPAATARRHDEASVAQHPEVVRQKRSGYVDLVEQFAHAARATGELSDDTKAGRVPESPKAAGTQFNRC